MLELLDLPQEILIKILSYVSFTDRLQFVLVSKTGRDRGSAPPLWRCVRLATFFNEETFRQFLDIERYSKVQILQIERKGQVVVIEFYPNPLDIEEDEPFEESGSFLDAYFKNLKKLTLLNCVAGSQEWNNIFQQIIVGGEF